MSSVKVFSVNSTTATRLKTDGTGGQGDGHSKHLYVGRYGSYDYKSYIKFNLDWSGVGKIVSAVLNIYTDEYNTFGTAGEPGIMAQPAVTESPIVVVRRCTTAPTFGTNVDGTFDSSDYTKPQATTTESVQKAMTPHGANQLIQIDITAMVRRWAPTSVQGGSNYSNYGIALYGDTSTAHNWSGWSQYHTGGGGAAEQPSITLTYELAPTAPNAPANLDPNSLSLPSLSTFEGDFSDIKAGDTLVSTDIEIYDAGVAATGTGSTNRINKTAHGLKNGANIWVTAATGGGGIPSFTKLYVRNVTTNDFQISTTATGTVVDFNDYSAITYSVQLAARNYVATNSDRVAGHFIIPLGALAWSPKAFVTYRWRARNRDQEGQIGAWAGLTSFKLIDTPPNAPTLSPLSGSSYSSFNLVLFRGGTFSDPDGGDRLTAHQVQLSTFPAGDTRWDDEPDAFLWDTGKQFDAYGATKWEEPYGGRALAAGTYYWRAKQWDSKDQESAWSYAQIILTQPFSPDPGNYANVQVNPKAPWRILIRNLYQADGVTKTVGRAPGQLVAVLEEAKNVGASVVYNSPGEIHFTLLKDDPQVAVIEPKQTHYALEFYSGDGWQEKYTGVVWDVDATETDVVFKGIDYLALYDTCIDERYDPLKPNLSYTSNGSFYDNIAIRTIVLDQLNWAKKQPDSWVGFIGIGQIDAMNEKVSVYSTFQPTLSFVSGLIDSHRQGTGKRTRMSVVKTTSGAYQLKIVDDPGIIRNDLALYYGELVQGYRIIVFGDGWANVMHTIGRNREGSKVTYRTIKGQSFQPSTSLYGRIATVSVMDGITDQNDLQRRGLEAAIQAAKLGKNIAIGLRTEFLSPPLQGYDVCDVFPVKILDGAIDTTRFGSGYWSALAVAWEASDVGEQSLIITVVPREDSTAPNPDLLVSKKKISTQPEWQLGWKPPDPLKATSSFYLDQKTGIVYTRIETTGKLTPVTGSP